MTHKLFISSKLWNRVSPTLWDWLRQSRPGQPAAREPHVAICHTSCGSHANTVFIRV